MEMEGGIRSLESHRVICRIAAKGQGFRWSAMGRILSTNEHTGPNPRWLNETPSDYPIPRPPR
jgi:hypothetical protein